MDQKTLKKLDVALLAILPVVATALTLGMRLNYLWAILLMFGLPALWLSIRTPRMVLRTAIFAGILSVLFAVILNHIGVVTGSWLVPHSVLPWRLLGTVPLEDFVGSFFAVYGVVICYEHFLDKGRHRLVDRKMKYLLWPIIIAVGAFLGVALGRPGLLEIPYAYAWIGVIFCLLPVVATARYFPRLLSKYIKVGAYFTLLLAVFEYNGLLLGHWVFPGGDTLGWVPYFGFRVPFEEVAFFIVLSVIAILSYYEFFDDDLQ